MLITHTENFYRYKRGQSEPTLRALWQCYRQGRGDAEVKALLQSHDADREYDIAERLQSLDGGRLSQITLYPYLAIAKALVYYRANKTEVIRFDYDYSFTADDGLHVQGLPRIELNGESLTGHCHVLLYPPFSSKIEIRLTYPS